VFVVVAIFAASLMVCGKGRGGTLIIDVLPPLSQGLRLMQP